MTKAGFWSTDWFLGLAVSLVFLFAGGSRLIEGLERSAYDWGVNAPSRVPSDRVAVIAIDDVSIANIGRWPWPRDKLARIIDMLAGAKAKIIGNTMYEPENDVVKVTDFGIARITDSSKTKTGMVLGTPSYMSPEQLQGKKIDGRSDLFSLAVGLYQLACGKLPFEGESLAQLMYKIANEHAADILKYNPSLPPAFVAFLDMAMAKEAEQRYQTGEEFAAALRTIFGATAPGGTGARVDISL